MPFARKPFALIAEDDPGHARLIEKNLERSGIGCAFMKFENGQTVLDFLFRRGTGPHRDTGTPYLLLLDIRMPKMGGIEVLRLIKEDPELRLIPVIMLSTSDDSREIEKCHQAGCSHYVVKPVNYDRFCEAVKVLGDYIALVHLPTLIPYAQLP